MNIANHRLYAQHIEGEKFDTPLQAVRHLGAIQAQDFGQAVWAVGLRMKNPSLATIEKAIANKEIVLTWPMRGTIHFVPAEDAKWMLGLMAQKGVRAGLAHARQLGVDNAIMARAEAVFTAALSGGKQLMRGAMMQCLIDVGIDTTAQRGYLLLRHFSQTGLLCLASAEGKQQTFALLDEWVPSSKMLEKEEALAEIASRYFISHGPATIRDFANWTGLAMSDAKTALQIVESRLLCEIIDGNEFYFSDNSFPAISGVHLLPGFDEYFLGYKDRGHIISPEHASKVVPGGNGIFKPMIVSDGRVVGTWKRTLKKASVEVAYDLFDAPIPEEQLQGLALSYAQFVNLPLAR